MVQVVADDTDNLFPIECDSITRVVVGVGVLVGVSVWVGVTDAVGVGVVQLILHGSVDTVIPIYGSDGFKQIVTPDVEPDWVNPQQSIHSLMLFCSSYH